MNKKEIKQVNETLYNIYSGIIKNNMEFAEGKEAAVVFEFDCKEYEELKEKYKLEEIAKTGTDFQRALRLLHHFAPRLKHMSNYTNHITCNALALLDYCYEKEDVGINCLNKSKILEECCLAIGIYARRVGIMPYSPYDSDTHVVTEIFDRKMQKWIMIDCTSDGYYIDENGTPLSCMEIREKIGNQDLCTIVYPRQSTKDIEKLFEKNLEDNVYYAKNMFWLRMDEYSTFGEKGKVLYFPPKGFDMRQFYLDMFSFTGKQAEKIGMDITFIEERKEAFKKKEMEKFSIEKMWEVPVR